MPVLFPLLSPLIRTLPRLPRRALRTVRLWHSMGQWLLRCFRQVPYAVIAVAIAVGVLSTQHLGLLDPLEQGSYEYWVRQRPQWQVPGRSTPESDIVVIGITEADIRAQNQWPLSDQTLAQLLNTLQQQSPRAIGIDLHRDIAYPPGQPALQSALQSKNIFVIESLIDGIPPPSEMPPEQVGFNDLLVDVDGVVRRNLFYATEAGETYYSLSLRMALFLLGENITNATQFGVSIGSVSIPALTSSAGGYRQVDDTGYQTLLQYRQSPFEQISLADALTGQAVPMLTDKVILIGTVAPSIKDTFFTPFSPVQDQHPMMPGVLIHAHSLHQLMRLAQGQAQALNWVAPPLEGLWIFGWAWVGGYLAWRYRRPLLVVSLTGVALAVLFALCRVAFYQQYWLICAAPTAALFLALLVVTVYKVFYYSYYDPMTQLANRALFLRWLQTCLRDSASTEPLSMVAPAVAAPLHAVLFIDIDGFKSINDSLGQEGGNHILCQVADHLRYCLPQASIARVGGDEFAALLRQIRHSGEAAEVAIRLQKQLAQLPSTLPVVITASIGIALQPCGAGYRAADLLQDAHRATHRARQLGRERYEVFARGMRAQAVSQFQLEMDLRLALERQAFELHYQPIIDLSSGSVAGFEALIRWRHDQQGFISPGAFIPVAEETGLIIPLGQWVLETACRQAQHWCQQFPRQSPLSISVNLSSRQFNQSGLVNSVQAILTRTGLSPQQLKLELTESVAMENVDLAIEQLLRLKQMGLQISLDDFGTGYSSLSYLHRFSIDTLKVDRSFVSRMDAADEDGDIVCTIIKLGHQLGMAVVAEGIETASQYQSLQALGCDYGQGYWFSKPLPAQQATHLLQQPNPW